VSRFGVRVAAGDDVPVIGRLLDAFNREFGEPTPGPDHLAGRLRQLIAGGEAVVLVAGDEPAGLAVLRFRDSLWTDGLECYLAELYVAPRERGKGLGRALMEAALELAKKRGADYMELNTAETDETARRLYESLGFTNREGSPEGPRMYYYERTL
jgi:ribosomal protein S18 acetylase RimI-like enzyme